MMKHFTVSTVILTSIFSAACWLAGCGKKADSGDAEAAGNTALTSQVQIEPTQPVTTSTPTFSLNLKQGEQFPMMKTVEQVVTQLGGKSPQSSRSQLELLMALKIEDVRSDGTKKMRVDYQRVRYSLDIGGEQLRYDSDRTNEPAPAGALAYQGLVNNGFSFWIAPDHRLLNIEEFPKFLERCVKHVPEHQRKAVMTELVATAGDEGIANFVDDSIGLLPHAGELKRPGEFRPGFLWTRERQVLRPVPIYMTTHCLLKDLDDKRARVEITGSIRPSATYGPAEQVNSGLRITVVGGRSSGHCEIERRSGMPLHSRIDRAFDMVVRLPDGQEFRQRKLVGTTIQVFAQQGPQKDALAVKPQNLK